MKNADHKTLAGGALGDTQYVDASDHIHIHFLDEGSTEVCCHGCGKSVIHVHPPLKSMKVREASKSFIKEHEHHFIPGASFEEWCPDIRTSVSVVDTTKRPSSSKVEGTQEQ